MGIKIDNNSMRSDETAHTATHAQGGGIARDVWRVSWLPGHLLTRNEAITAMTLAEAIDGTAVTTEDKIWPHITGWAAELGMGPEAAILGIRQPPPVQPQRQA